MPLVSVLMSVRNGEASVGLAVQSILNQTLPDLELLVVDDGSTDGTSDVLASLRDPRMRIFEQPTSVGLTRALKFLGAKACSPFLARIDADDLSHPDRLHQQVSALRAHPDVGLAGTAFAVRTGTSTVCRAHFPPAAPAGVRWMSLFRNPFAHSSVIMRADTYHAAGGYDPEYVVAQDFELWERMLRLQRGMNLTERLVCLGRSDDSISALRSDEQELVRALVSIRAIRRVLDGADVDETVAADLNNWMDRFPRRLSTDDKPQLELLVSLLLALITASSGDDLERFRAIATEIYLKSRISSTLGLARQPSVELLRQHVTVRSAANQATTRAVSLLRRRQRRVPSSWTDVRHRSLG